MVVICQFVYLHKLAMNNVFICRKYSVLTRMVLTYGKQALLFRHSGQKRRPEARWGRLCWDDVFFP
jgi:hypothetical protein